MVQKRYAFDGSGQPLVQYDAAGARTWMLPDERGSVVALANDSAAVTTINTFDEYGIPGGSNAGTFQYAGMQWLSRPAVYAPTFRAYAQHLGRFNQTDPLGYGGDEPNLYAYVLNDPVNAVDPLGLAPTPNVGPEIVVTAHRIEPVPDGLNAANLMQLIGDLSRMLDDAIDRTIQNVMRPPDQERHCGSPPSAPRTGMSRDALRALAQRNATSAQTHTLPWFYQQVRNGGAWDYKQRASGFTAFGNYNYGYAGAARGIPRQVLLRAAGWAQRQAGTSNSDWGNPSGNSPYGDDPADQALINRGYNDYVKCRT